MLLPVIHAKAEQEILSNFSLSKQFWKLPKTIANTDTDIVEIKTLMIEAKYSQSCQELSPCKEIKLLAMTFILRLLSRWNWLLFAILNSILLDFVGLGRKKQLNLGLILKLGQNIDWCWYQNSLQKGKCTALHFAATQGATEIVKLMVSSYSGNSDIVNEVDGNHETLLHRQVSLLSFWVQIFRLHAFN